jgi:hypothetical protein
MVSYEHEPWARSDTVTHNKINVNRFTPPPTIRAPRSCFSHCIIIASVCVPRGHVLPEEWFRSFLGPGQGWTGYDELVVLSMQVRHWKDSSNRRTQGSKHGEGFTCLRVMSLRAPGS